ncbi:MAG: tetratricopeptide repeat protein [Desulfuromonadaceae bacterium]|nr:tetratricopeptide repeat protein [Desulfuromonadaceae bacterium]MDD5104045.1 tetratricopeptide repeat protein [Desulfuromonadaceae bacterium]
MVLLPGGAFASIPNNLYRLDVLPHYDFTRVTVSLAESPQYKMVGIPGNRLRIVLHDTNGTLYKKFRSYSDKNIGGLVLKKRGDSLLITFQIARNAGWRDLSRSDISAVTVDIGASFKQNNSQSAPRGREKIWHGVEKLVRDFDPPLKSEIPFTQTDRQILKNFLPEEEMKEFLSGEAALYKGSLTDAEAIFTRFTSQQGPIRPLALYRLAESWYKLQKYHQALAAFREAEKLWPNYLGINPGAAFCYCDSLARSGELGAARSLLATLVSHLADKSYAPALLVRVGDILARQGHDREARAIYLNIAENFTENKASQMALMRMADSTFLQTTPWNYRPLSEVYLNASRQGGDLDMREEAHFKHVLLEAMYGEAGEALQLVMGFQRKFPRGVYVAVVRTMREVLVAEVFKNTPWKNDSVALIRFMDEQYEYLSGCIETPGFLATVTRAYTEAGRPIELVKLLTALVERMWAAPIAPELYVSIVDNSELIGDTSTAERAIKGFLGRFPGNSRARLMTERLGAIYFGKEKYQQVKETLLWLLNKGEHAQHAVSYYQLGRSLWSLQLYGQAAKAMGLFIASPDGRDPRLVPDAFFVSGAARENSGDKKGALKQFEAALRLPDNPRSEEFMYRAGQVNLQVGNTGRAKTLFGQLAKNGKDADWQRLAQQALTAINQ